MRLTLGLAATAASAALLMQACEAVPLTAAPGTTMTLMANPTFVAANGGVSVVTAILVEKAGTFVPDGTEVFFFTDLGRVDASGKTRNGVARVNFVSDARSGTATVTGISGGPAPAPSASPTASTGAPPSEVAARDAAGGTTPPVAVGIGSAAGENSAFVPITIGSALPERVLVTADPPMLEKSRSTSIVANVFDQFGNPVQNVPVIFQVSEGVAPSPSPFAASALLEFLASGGAPQHTDSSGRAFDTLTTRTVTGTSQKTVIVTATTANDKTNNVRVVVYYTAVTR